VVRKKQPIRLSTARARARLNEELQELENRIKELKEKEGA